MSQNEYSYSPPRGDKVSTVITYALVGAAALLIVFGEIFTDIKPIFQASGFGALLLSVMFFSKYLLSGYTYTVTVSEDGESADLVVVENSGKRNRTVCRVCATDSRIFKAKKPGGRVWDYRPSPFVTDHWVFTVSERDGGGFIRFCPDRRMLDILRALGCEVEQ